MQLCLLKITWPKKAIPTKSYSLVMLHLHHKNIQIMHNPYDKPSNKQLFHTFGVLKPFQLSRNT